MRPRPAAEAVDPWAHSGLPRAPTRKPVAAPPARHNEAAAAPSARRIRRRQSSGRSLTSHSRRRRTRKPEVRSLRPMRTSRLRFRAIFALQYARFVFGMCPHFGQPCQKHPSTKRATRCLRITRSGFPRVFAGCSRHPRTPCRRSSETSRASVVLFPDERIARMFLLRFSAGLLNGGSPFISVPAARVGHKTSG